MVRPVPPLPAVRVPVTPPEPVTDRSIESSVTKAPKPLIILIGELKVRLVPELRSPAALFSLATTLDFQKLLAFAPATLTEVVCQFVKPVKAPVEKV